MPDFIQDRNIDVQFGQGQNVKRDKLSMPLGQLSQFKNGWFDTDGALTKRFGAKQLGTGGTAQALYTFRSELDELIPGSNGALRVYDPVAAAWNNAAGNAPIYRTTRKPLRRNVSVPQPGPTGVAVGTIPSVGISSPVNFDMAYISANVGTGGTGDYLVWCESPQAGASSSSFVAGIVSVATGAVAGQSLTIAGFNPTLVNMGGSVALVYAKTKTSGIFYRVLSPSTLTWGSETTLQASGGQDDTNYDVVAYASNKIGLVYQSGAAQMTVENFTFSAGTFSVVNSLAYNALLMNNVSIGYLATNAYLAIAGGSVPSITAGTSINYAVWNPATGLNVALGANTGSAYTAPAVAPSAGVVRALPVDGGAAAWSMLVELTYVPFLGTYINTALWPNVISSSATNFTTGALTNTTLFLGGGLASRPFLNATTGVMCVFVAAQSAVQTTTYLIDAVLGRVMGVLAPGSAGGYIPQPYGTGTVGIGSHVPSVSLVGSNIWCPLLTQTNVTAVNGQLVSNLVLDVAQLVQAAPVGVDAGDGLYLAGSFVGRYDGRVVTEHNWFQFPEGVVIQAADFNIAGAISPAGQSIFSIIPPANGGAGIATPLQWSMLYGMTTGVGSLAAPGGGGVGFGSTLAAIGANPINVVNSAPFASILANSGAYAVAFVLLNAGNGFAAISFTGAAANKLTGCTVIYPAAGAQTMANMASGVVALGLDNAAIVFGSSTQLGSAGPGVSVFPAFGGAYPVTRSDTELDLADKLEMNWGPLASQIGATVNLAPTAASTAGFAQPPPTSSTGFAVTEVAVGNGTIPHMVAIQCPAGAQVAPGSWFAFDYNHGGGNGAVVWFKIAGSGAKPNLSTTPSAFIEVDLVGTETPYAVANAIGTAIVASLGATNYGFMQTGSPTPLTLGGPYDGTLVLVDAALATGPTKQLGTFNFNVAGQLSQGVYRYAVTYRATDAQGNVDESGYITQAVNVYGGQGNGCILTIPPCRITNRLTPGVFGGQTITAEVYRSVANDSVGPLYRVTNSANPLVIPPGSSTPLTFVDVMDDVTLQGNAQIYTAGNVALNSAPPAMSILHAAQGRLVGAGIEGSPTSYWYSEVGNSGTLKNFSAFFQGTLPDNSEAITAVTDMDAYTVFFRQSSIYYIAGGGPDATGGGTQFSSPQRIPGNIGCPSGLAISHPNGVLFVSAQGVKNLGRDLQITDVDGSDPYFLGANLGAGVEAPLATFVGAILDPQYRSVLFYGPNLTVAWNYVTGQWSEFTSMVSASMVAWYGPDLTSATLVPLTRAAVTYLDTSNNSIWQECSALSAVPVYADKAGPIAMTWQTGRLPLAGPNGLTNIEDVFVNGNFPDLTAQYFIPDDANAIIHVNGTDLNAGTSKIGPVWTKVGPPTFNAADAPIPSVGPFAANKYYSLPGGNVLDITTGPLTLVLVCRITTAQFSTLLTTDVSQVTGLHAIYRGDGAGYGQFNNQHTGGNVATSTDAVVGATTVFLFGVDATGKLYAQINGGALASVAAGALLVPAVATLLGSDTGNFLTGELFEFLASTDVPSGTAFTALYNAILANIGPQGPSVVLSCFYDGDDTYSDSISMTPGSSNEYPSGQAGSPPTSLRFSMRRQSMSFLTLQMTENVASYPAAGLPLQITGITLAGGILPEHRNIGPGSNTYAG